MQLPSLNSLVIRRLGVAFAAVAAALPAVADAQTAGYPAKPVRMIVPFSAGSPIELPARAIGQRLAETMGQQFVVENRTGASGTIGTEAAAKAPPDGYTLLFTNCSHGANPSFFKKLPYDTVADFAPITQTNGTYGNLLVVHPSVPARSVKEFIALAKARPGQLHYASAGVGSPPHVAAALFAAMAGINLTHVPYRGTAATVNDVVGGHIEVMLMSPITATGFVKSGRLRALGISGPVRSPWLPDVPTILETGLTGYDVTCWHGMWFPAGTPAEIVRRVHAEVVKALAVPEVRKHIVDNGLRPLGSSPEEFAEFLRKDIARQASIAKKIGIQPQ
ncbi:MAG: tripartite tricarboxylate transporter substrate binding protein [Betaproteobacteria bacterium]|nr:tripartite tricarboxylate transporter substrate binding protein [Betaproteobacteria bacterium]